MSSVDNRVVNMVFDNQKFEKGVESTIKSLDKLNDSLQLEDATKGLLDVDKTAKGITFATLSNGVESVSVKFTALGVVAVTALQNITNSLINTGKNLVSSLTIDPVIEGFQEYELKMDSVQNIMNGTGETLEVVSDRLDELNTYADRTIYSFSDMTSNIGKFTNSGVGLDDAVGAIQGVANAAALSGSNAQQASHAMYNFAQALASGHIKLIDWKSIETANMATVEFKQQLLDSAVAAGTLTKSADGMYTVMTKNGTGANMKETISATQNFNDSLAYQWMTTEVLIGTLNDYADETTDIGKRAFKAATEVKTFTQLLDTMQEAVGSGWAETWELVIGNFDEAKEVLTEISQAFDKMIDASADARNGLLQSWKDLGGRTAIIDGIRNSVIALASVLTPIKEAFRDIFPPITAEALVSISEKFKSFTETLKLSSMTTDNLKSTFKGFFAVLDIGKELFLAVAKAVSATLGYILPVGDGVLAITGSFGDFLVTIRNVIKESEIFNRVFDTLGTILKPVADILKDTINQITTYISSFRSVDTSAVDNVGERLAKGFRPFEAIANVVKGAFEIVALAIKKVMPLFASIGSIIGEGLRTAQTGIMNWLSNVNFSGGLDLLNAGLFSVILVGIKNFINKITDVTDEAGGILEGIKSIFEGVTGTFEAVQSRLKADVLMKIAGAIAVLSASLLVLSMIDSNKLTTALTAITVLFMELFVSMTAFQKIASGKAIRGAGKMILVLTGLSTAILILSVAMKTLASLDWGGLLKGLTATSVLIAVLVTSLKTLPSKGKLVKGAAGLIAFAVSINILATAVKKLGGIDTASLTKGLIGIGVLLTELSLFMNMTDLDGKGLLKGLGIMALSTALVILSSAVRKLSEIDTASLAKGLIGIGVLLTELGIFLNMTGDVRKVMSTAVGMTILATSLLIFAKAVSSMGSMSWEELVKGMLALGGALASMTIALNLIQGALGGAAALLVVAGALAILTPVLYLLGNMSWQAIVTGLTTLASTFAIIGGAAVLLGPLTPAILGLAGSITLLGVSIALIGGGILALSAGLTALGLAGTAGVGALVLAVTGLIGLVPMFIQQIAYGVIAFANVIGDGGPAIIKAFTAIFTSLAEAFIVSIPLITTAAMTLLNSLFDTLIDFIPRLVEGGMQLVLGILQGIEDNIGDIVKSAISIVVNFIDGISSMVPSVIQAAFDLMISFIDGLATAIEDNTQTVIDSLLNLASTIITSGADALKEGASSFIDAGKDLIRGFIDGIKDGLSNVKEAAKDVGEAALNGVKGILKIQSPSKVFKDEIGKNVGAGLVQGLKASIPNVTKESANLGNATMTGTAEGITKNSGKVTKAASNAAKSTYQATKEWVDTQRKYHDLSLDEEYSKWKSIQNKYKEGSKERLDIELRMREIQQQKVREQYDFSKKWIDDEKFYKRLKLEEELAAWERVHNRYKEGTKQEVEFAKQAAKEIFRLKNEIVKAEFENSKRWIDEEKYYKRLSLTDELAAWERVHNRYKDGSKDEVEYAKQAAREIFRIKNELNDKLIAAEEKYNQKVKALNQQLRDDIKSLRDEYKRAVDDRTKALANAYGLFDKVSKSDDPISGAELLDNLKGQVAAFEDWQGEIDTLVSKGVSESLVDELREMGPKALEQIQALNQLSEPELAEYEQLWKTKHSEARTQAENELRGLRQDTRDQIRELRRETRTQLDLYREDWDNEVANIKGVTVNGFSKMREQTGKQMQYLHANTVYEMHSTTQDMRQVVEDEDWVELGVNIIDGIIEGAESRRKALINTMKSIAKAAKNAAESTLGIASPSREFMKIGAFTIEGFKQGLQNGSDSLVDSVKDMGTSVISSMSSTMKLIENVVDSDMNLSPVITPVLDLDKMRSDSNSMNKMLGNNRKLATDVSFRKANQTQASIDSANANFDSAAEDRSISFVQNNYSPKALSRVDIYRQTKNQISTMKGVLNNI